MIASFDSGSLLGFGRSKPIVAAEIVFFQCVSFNIPYYRIYSLVVTS